MSFSEELSQLLRNRLAEQGNQPEIDREIWSKYGREATVVITDLSKCTAITREKGILHLLSQLCAYFDLVFPLLERNRGKLVKQEGDSLFLIFDDPGDALNFAVESRTACVRYNQTSKQDMTIRLCQGIADGEILFLEHDLFGDPVNTASKLGEDIAGEEEILVTDDVYRQVRENFPELDFNRRELEVAGLTLNYYSVK